MYKLGQQGGPDALLNSALCWHPDLRKASFQHWSVDRGGIRALTNQDVQGGSLPSWPLSARPWGMRGRAEAHWSERASGSTGVQAPSPGRDPSAVPARGCPSVPVGTYWERSYTPAGTQSTSGAQGFVALGRLRSRPLDPSSGPWKCPALSFGFLFHWVRAYLFCHLCNPRALPSY